MVDVEQCALSTLKEDAFVLFELVVDQVRSTADGFVDAREHPQNTLRPTRPSIRFPRGLFCVRENAVPAWFAERLGRQDHRSDSRSADLVCVSWSNASAGGADLGTSFCSSALKSSSL